MGTDKFFQLGKPPLLMEFFRMPGYYENDFWRIIANLVWVVLLMLALAVLVISGTLLNDQFLTLDTLKIILSALLPVGLTASVMWSS